MRELFGKSHQIETCSESGVRVVPAHRRYEGEDQIDRKGVGKRENSPLRVVWSSMAWFWLTSCGMAFNSAF